MGAARTARDSGSDPGAAAVDNRAPGRVPSFRPHSAGAAAPVLPAHAWHRPADRRRLSPSGAHLPPPPAAPCPRWCPCIPASFCVRPAGDLPCPGELAVGNDTRWQNRGRGAVSPNSGQPGVPVVLALPPPPPPFGHPELCGLCPAPSSVLPPGRCPRCCLSGAGCGVYPHARQRPLSWATAALDRGAAAFFGSLPGLELWVLPLGSVPLGCLTVPQFPRAESGPWLSGRCSHMVGGGGCPHGLESPGAC